MDPTTTLITFLLKAAPLALSVSLVGSWDNFKNRYPMERDERRGRDQWRGCYAFSDIICDGGSSVIIKRQGGLKMGQTYWYYYELDDGTELYDKTLPATTSCPFLPGQPLNLLFVPVEIYPVRDRSASVGALPIIELKTLNPQDKYRSPRQQPPAPKATVRLGTSISCRSTALETSAESQGLKGISSPWSPRSLFGGLKLSPPKSRHCEKRRKLALEDQERRKDATSSSVLTDAPQDGPGTPTTPRHILSKEALREIAPAGSRIRTRSVSNASFLSHYSSVRSVTERYEDVGTSRYSLQSPSRRFTAQTNTAHERRPRSPKGEPSPQRRAVSYHDDFLVDSDDNDYDDDDDGNFAHMLDLEESSKATTSLFPSHYTLLSPTLVGANQIAREKPLPLIPRRPVSRPFTRGISTELPLLRESESHFSIGYSSTAPGSPTDSEFSSVYESPRIETPITSNLFEEAFKMPLSGPGADHRDTFGGLVADCSNPLLAEIGYLGTMIA